MIMGKRRGRTGPGGAVVSSLSQNPGGTITPKKGQPAEKYAKRKDKRENVDKELNELAKLSGKDGPSSSSDYSSGSGRVASSSGWLGKSPQEMLREWCSKNSRSRPSFYPVDGSDGLMKCVVHRGRKDGKKGTGLAFDLIVGVGDKAGEEFAALNVLHRIEHGKPLERLLAPEYRPTWLELDKRHDTMQKIQAQKRTNREKREQATKRRETFEKSKQSATLHISSDSRQMIEDALLCHKTNNQSAQAVPSSDSRGGDNLLFRKNVSSELVRMGFAELDAIDASTMFSDCKDAVQYLCLNLDESELPASFAPKPEVEVAQFYPSTNRKGPLLNQSVKSELVRLSCLSKFAVEKAMKRTKGDVSKAYSLLFSILTHSASPSEDKSFANDVLKLAEEARNDEAESIKAIFDDDVDIGVGCLRCFASNWTAIVKLSGGCPGIQYPNPLSVAFIDSNNCYPISAPMVTVITSQPEESAVQQNVSAAERRLLMRAIAGKITCLREAHISGFPGTEPVPVIHQVIDFLAEATREQLLDSAFNHRISKAVSVLPEIGSKGDDKPEVIRMSVSSRIRPKFNQQRSAERPSTVDKLESSPELSDMLKRRRNLPAFSVRQNILETISQNQIVIISGATGSGKTTQIPQFILENAAETQEPINIVCTQPRRIAAISVAERVAAERCQAVGHSVGYQVKLKSNKSKSTRLLFCTTGILLRRLQGDPSLKDLTHILVDEVHERSIETDFLLLLLHEILPTRPALKVVLMSATLDAKKFASYFALDSSAKQNLTDIPIIYIPGRAFPVEQFYLKEAVDVCGYTLKPGDRYAVKPKINRHYGKYGPEPPPDADFSLNKNSATIAATADDPMDTDMCEDDELTHDSGQVNIANQSSGLSFSTENTMRNNPVGFKVSMIDEEQVNIDLIGLLVNHIDAEGRTRGDMGAILIFLPGAAEISLVSRRLINGPQGKYLWVLPLHSLLSPDDQRNVFMKGPAGKRKVICSTNIAETSITVDDVTTVIDTGRVKEMGYDAVNCCSVLEEQYISKAAAKQRAGRAGRVSKGNCYLLVRQSTFENHFKAHLKPEIQRVGLEHLILNALAIIPDCRIHGDPKSFLRKAVDPPSDEAIDTAISNLLDIGALVREESELNSTGSVKLSGLGKHLSRLPVDAKIERSVFNAPFDRRDEAREAKKSFAWGKSDLLLFVTAFKEWQAVCSKAGSSANEKAFCAKNFLSKKTLILIADERKQLADALRYTGLCGEDANNLEWYKEDRLNQNNGNERVIRAVVCAALYPNIVRIDAEQKYKKVRGGAVTIGHSSKDLKLRDRGMRRLFIHPESVNFFENNYDTRWLAYYSKVLTSKLFIRDTTMVSPYAILLFGGDIEVLHEKGQIAVDKWVIFKSPARIGVLARELRRELDGLLSLKFEDNIMDLTASGKAITDAVVKLISTEIYQL